MKKECEFCGKLIVKRVNESLKDWKTTHRFCSKKCFDEYRRGKPSPSPSTTFQKNNKIYSFNDTRTKKLGPENNKWKGGITPIHEKIRKDLVYKKWRECVFERDDYTCQKCGKRGGDIHAHHELSFSDYPELRVEILNGMTLCVSCHRKIHRKDKIISK